MTVRIVDRPFGAQCVFECPRGTGTCQLDLVPTPGEEQRWQNIGTTEKPTLTPSVICRCGFHGYVMQGKLVDAPPGMVSSMHACPSCSVPVIMGFSIVDGTPQFSALLLADDEVTHG